MPNDQNTPKPENDQNKDALIKPDPETLHSTDPQDHMEGPISSLMQITKEALENDDETKEEADKKKDEHM